MNIATKLGTLYLGDCNEILPTLDVKADLILTDPPYGTNDGKGKTIKRSGENTSFCDNEWDKELPTDWISLLPDIMKDDRWGVVFTDKMAISKIWHILEEKELPPRNTFYWVKTNKAPTPRCNFKSCVETAVVFTKGRTNKHWYGGGNMDNVFTGACCPDGLHPTQKNYTTYATFN